MAKQIKPTQIKKMIEQAIAKQQRWMDASRDSENTCIKEMNLKSQGMNSAFTAVLWALNGDNSLLSVYAEENK